MADIINFIERKDSRELETLKQQAQAVLNQAEEILTSFFKSGSIAVHRNGGPPLLILGVQDDKIQAAYFDPTRKALVQTDLEPDQIIPIVPHWI